MATPLCSTNLALDLSNLASRFDRHHAHLSQIVDEVDKPGSEPISFDQMGAAKILSAARRLNFVANDRNALKRFKEEVEKLPNDTCDSWETYSSLSMQVTDIEGPSRRCRDFGDQIVSALILRVDGQFEKAMRALTTYRESRLTANWINFCQASHDLRRWITAMKTDRESFVAVSQWEFTKEQLGGLIALTTTSLDLQDMISGTPETFFLQTLDSLLENKPSSGSIDIVHRSFQSLTDEAQRLLDQAIYDLSKDPGKQKGPEWAEANRYVDLQLFRAAYLHMVRTYWITHHTYMSDPLRQARYYKQLRACAYAPQCRDRKAWVENELPYLMSLIPSVDNMVHHKLGQIAISRGNKNAPNPAPQKLSIFRSK